MISTIYDEMWSEFCSALEQNKCSIDPYIFDTDDTRRGITALAYLNSNSQSTTEEINNFLNQVKKIEPDQYYHPLNELHFTIASIISCYEGFKLSDIDSSKYIEIFNEAVTDTDPIEITLKGVTASPSCIMIQGFPATTSLDNLRNNLRRKFNKSNLYSDIDKRYRLITAHATCVRFTSSIESKHQLLELCKQYRNYNFGTVILREFELVFNNWYQNLEVTKSLAKHFVS